MCYAFKWRQLYRYVDHLNAQSFQILQCSHTVLLAHILGKVNTLCIVSLSVYTWTRLPIFSKIGSYLTDTEQKKSKHVFH